jgi:hypothetical protein
LTAIPDLSLCTALPIRGDKLVAIGWLGKSLPFAQGITPRDVFTRLQEFVQQPWQPFVLMGLHECELCQFAGERGTTNLFIPYQEKLYVCPELITHYINAHHYQPPAIFCEAVLACPPLDSMLYKKRLLECGSKELVQFSQVKTANLS